MNGPMNLEHTQKALESALNAGQVRILGERGKPSIAPGFVQQLTRLSPVLRRLAITKACAVPWRDRVDELPVAFRWELIRAASEAAEDTASDETVDQMFAGESAPISEVLLEQIAGMGPVDRYVSLVLALAALAATELRPEWLQQELDYVCWLAQDNYHHIRNNERH